jgi:hypothetical protein
MKISEYYPTEINGKWYAGYKSKSQFSSKVTEKVFYDMNGDKLEFINREEVKSWCDTRNEIDNII